MPTTSPLKRPSGGGGGGRLRRLLASLRPPARAGPLPVQTGFPTSLADIVVKNHGRLRNPRRRHRAAVTPSAAAEEPAPVPQERSELSVDHDAAARALAPVTARPGRGAGCFSIRPGILAAGGALALALLVIWSKQLVAAATIASVALSWIEYARTVCDRRPETEEEVDSPRGRGCVSLIHEAAESPRLGCGESDSDNGRASLWSADADSGDLGRDESSSSVKRKQSRRSLRKLLATKLRNGKKPRGMDSRHAGDAVGHEHEHERPETPRRLSAEFPAAAAAAPADETPTSLTPEAITVNNKDRCHCRCRGALPLPALVPIILAGLVAGKLPALALAVLCAAFSSSAERVPVPGPAGQQASR